jgi:hypothetical protein
MYDVHSKHRSVHVLQPTTSLPYPTCRYVDRNRVASDGCEAQAQVVQFKMVRFTSQPAARRSPPSAAPTFAEAVAGLTG